MDRDRSAERVKRLKVEPVNDSLLRFHASLVDTAYDANGDELIHSLSIDGTISVPELEILTAEPYVVQQPHPECTKSLDPVRNLVGCRIGPGYRSKVQGILGGTSGCSHFLTLAFDLGASHTLSLFLRMRSQGQFENRNAPEGFWIRNGLKIEPRLENACIALTSDSTTIANAKRERV